MHAGVIAVETQTVMLHIPADPGAPDSSERDVPQAGQVSSPCLDDNAVFGRHTWTTGLPPAVFLASRWQACSLAAQGATTLKQMPHLHLSI